MAGNGDLALNPSGGFLSFGEATTAQALLQVCELTWQLRGQAEGRQVENARVAMSAVLGLGANGGSVVLKT
jgi:acetyl-CoA acetyltransferase